MDSKIKGFCSGRCFNDNAQAMKIYAHTETNQFNEDINVKIKLTGDRDFMLLLTYQEAKQLYAKLGRLFGR